MNSIHLLITFSVLISWCPFALAQEGDFQYDAKTKSVIPKFLGKVLLLKGKAQATDPKSQARPLKIGDKLYLNEIVATEDSSFLKIEMVDNSLITLGPKSEMKFDKFDYRTKEDRDSVYNLLKGQMRSQFRVKAPKDEAIKVKTGMISMGVRGTEFVVNRRMDEAKRDISEVLLIEGKIHLYDKLQKKDWQMKPRDHYVSIVHPNGKGTNVEETFDEETYEKLKGPELDPRRHFTPLLAFHEMGDVSLAAPRSSDAPSRGPASIEEAEKDDYVPTRSWPNTLNELNNRLKEND